MKVKAYVLFLTLILMLIFSLISYSVLMYVYYHKTKLADVFTEEKLNNNFYSAMNFAVVSDLNVDTRYEFDLYGQAEDSVSLKKLNWGLFSVYEIESRKGTAKKNGVFFMGFQASAPVELLYVSDMGKMLFASGPVIVNGMASLPSRGIRPGSVKTLQIPTKIKILQTSKSNTQLQVFPSELMNSADENIDVAMLLKNKNSVESFIVDDTIRNSFRSNTRIIISNNKLILSKKYLEGNIKIISTREIVVDSSSILNDVILIAPKISISNGFKGSMQCFSSDSIFLGKNVNLLYPSLLCVLSKQANSSITINEGSRIEGSIIALSYFHAQNVEVLLPYQFQLNGLLYVAGKLEIHGDIKGAVYTSRLVLKTKQGVFEDYITDVSIRPLDDYYSMMFNSFKDRKVKPSVAKWLQ